MRSVSNEIRNTLEHMDEIRTSLGINEAVIFVFSDKPLRITWITRKGEILKDQVVKYDSENS